jgi:hypothetical protein
MPVRLANVDARGAMSPRLWIVEARRGRSVNG